MKKKTTRQKPRPPKRKTPVSVRFRLMWIIPSVFALFTIGSGYFALGLSKYFFLPPRNPAYGETVGTLWILLGIFILAGLAAFSGAMIAHSITKPLKKLSKRAEMFTEGKIIKAPDEMSLLNNTLEEVFSTIDRYMKEGKILEALHEGTITLDRDGTITKLNNVAERVMGVGADGAEGSNFLTTFGKSPAHKMFLNLVDNALKRGEAQVFEGIEVHKDGVTVRLNGRITPKTDDTGEPEGATITFQDPFEVEQMRDWIKQADQMAGLGTMAAGIAHEIRNPLASIRGLMELIREDMPETDHKRKYAETIISEVDRVNRIVEEVLDFAQTDPSVPEPIDINDSLKQAIYVSKHQTQNRDIAIREDLCEDLPPVLAKQEKLTQAFENLLINAITATPEGGSIRITSTLMDGDELPSVNKTSPKRIVVRFFNTGSFIPPADTERIFLPFFSTKPDGTGLGLPITHRIISSHGGTIKVNSDKDRGTTFEIELPACT